MRADLPPVTGHQPHLDGIRAIAAFLVLVFHVAASTGYLARENDAVAMLLARGEIGVPIFFTLSGLLLFRPLARWILTGTPRPATGAYLVKRARRLLPAYWVVAAAALLIHSRDHLTDLWSWVSVLTLTYNYDPHPWWDNHLGPTGLGQMWSLTVEAAWYLLLPATGLALARLARGSARRLLYGIGAYAAISLPWAAFARHSPMLGVWLPRYLIWFAAGMALSVVAVEAHRSPAMARFARTVSGSWVACWLAALLLYGVAATPLTGGSRLFVSSVWTTEFQLVLYGLVAALLVAPVALAPAGHPALTAILGNPTMIFLGKISYGVFLWQFLVIYAWFRLIGRDPFTGSLPVDLPAAALGTVAVATASYYLVERRFSAPSADLRHTSSV